MKHWKHEGRKHFNERFRTLKHASEFELEKRCSMGDEDACSELQIREINWESRVHPTIPKKYIKQIAKDHVAEKLKKRKRK